MRNFIKTELPEWAKEMPSHLIDYAIFAAANAYKSNMAKKNINKNHKFTLSFKKKDNKETINIEKCFFGKNKNAIFISYLGNHIKSSVSFKDLPKKDATLTYNRVTDRWYLRIPIIAKKQKPCKKGICALDPGERTFMTLYSPDNVVMLGDTVSTELMKMCKCCDKIKSHMTKANHKKKIALRKALHRKIEKIKNKRDELHWKVTNYLTKNYNQIFLPPFETVRVARNLSHEVSRRLYNLSHYTFRQRLIYKCQERGVNLCLLGEEHTTVTCTCCGSYNYVGRSKTYKCSKCKLVIDRDVNAARNIFIKNMFESYLLQEQ